MTLDIFSQSLRLKLPWRPLCSNPTSASYTCTPSTLICELCHLTCCGVCVCVCVYVCMRTCVRACVWEREGGGRREREREWERCGLYLLVYCQWMSLLLLLYCPSLFSFSFFFFCTAHRALIYTRGSPLINISLFLLLLLLLIAMVGWAMSSWPIIKSHTDNACDKKKEEKKRERLHQLLKNVGYSHFL